MRGAAAWGVLAYWWDWLAESGSVHVPPAPAGWDVLV